MIFKVNQNNKTTAEEQKIPIKFDISMLNMFIGYIFKKSVQITRKSLMNMRKLFGIIDISIYENSDEMFARVEFIRKALEAKLVTPETALSLISEAPSFTPSTFSPTNSEASSIHSS